MAGDGAFVRVSREAVVNARRLCFSSRDGVANGWVGRCVLFSKVERQEKSLGWLARLLARAIARWFARGWMEATSRRERAPRTRGVVEITMLCIKD
jgi:hypothetical protein